MNRKLAATLIIILVRMSGLFFEVQMVEASGTIYIRADGSVEPEGTPISTFDNVTYTFTDNINDPIVVERDNIVVDGNGYVLQGSGSENGVHLSGRENVTIRNTQIEDFKYGIFLESSSNNTISGNSIAGELIEHGVTGITLNYSSYNSITGNSISTPFGGDGIMLFYSSNCNRISGNIITSNGRGMGLWNSCSNNTISENNITQNDNDAITLADSCNYNSISGNSIANNGWGTFIEFSSNNNSISGNNITQNGEAMVFTAASGNHIFHNNLVNNELQVGSYSSLNVWDDGYPSGGNYWSNYNGTDADSDGIGDAPYIIDANNTDHYPLMTQYVIPEFPIFFILPLFMIAALLAVIICRRKGTDAK